MNSSPTDTVAPIAEWLAPTPDQFRDEILPSRQPAVLRSVARDWPLVRAAHKDPHEALLLLEGPAAPDVLVTDVILATGMNGIDLANAARVQRPGLPVIFMSGYTAASEAQQRVRETGAPLLSKPFTTPQLESAVNAVCAARLEP